jgi:Uma2 family endonuclease
MADPAKRKATYADIEALPPHVVGEIIYGALVTHPRPTPPHATAHNALGSELTGPFQKGNGGPGGWVFMTEPELHLESHVLVPDLAGWRRERMAHMPTKAYVEISPDWVCEILSESTEDYDRGAKRDIYAKTGVGHLWLLDPRSKVLEIFQLTVGHWLLVKTCSGHDSISASPFEAVSFSLGALWPFDQPPVT